jgi:hypothetical protein
MNAKTLKRMYGLNYEALKGNLEGMEHSDSLVQPQPGGNCANWVLAHILATRNLVLEPLGAGRAMPEERAKRFSRGSPPLTDPSEAVPLGELISLLERSQESLVSALTSAPESALTALLRDQTVGEFLGVLQFHEAYHVGQLGLLRRIAGKEGAIP